MWFLGVSVTPVVGLGLIVDGTVLLTGSRVPPGAGVAALVPSAVIVALIASTGSHLRID